MDYFIVKPQARVLLLIASFYYACDTCNRSAEICAHLLSVMDQARRRTILGLVDDGLSGVPNEASSILAFP